MAEQIKLMSQYNIKVNPLEWSKYFNVFTNKDLFHVAIKYTPDDFLKSMRNYDFLKLNTIKKVGSYDFDDSSFLYLSKELDKKGLKISNVNWNEKAVQRLENQIDLEDIFDVKNFSEVIIQAHNVLIDDIQCIDKVTVMMDGNCRIQISRYGVLTILGSCSISDIQNLVNQVLL